MEQKKQTPQVRFKGYTDTWEQRKLCELGEITTGSTPSTANPNYYSEDGIPWVTPTDIESFTISDTPRKLSEEGANIGRVVPANTILCTCIASIGKNTLLTVKGSFNQQINSLTPSEENDAYFLLTESEIWSITMKRMAAAGTMQIVNKSEFSELKTMLPLLTEQRKIGAFFLQIDNLITLHQRKYNKLLNLKKAMLEKMFPQNGSLYPEIRFKGFTDTWEQRKLCELGEITTGSTPSTANPNYYSEDGIPWVTPTDIESFTISDTPRKLSEEGANIGRVVPANTILCTCIASIGKNTLLTVKGSFNQQINSLTPSEENDAYFLLTESEIWSITMKRMAAAGTMQIVNKSEFSELKTMLPLLTEQRKIGAFFLQIDNLITLHQRKLEKLKQIKKSCLEKMFV